MQDCDNATRIEPVGMTEMPTYLPTYIHTSKERELSCCVCYSEEVDEMTPGEAERADASCMYVCIGMYVYVHER